MKKNYIKLEKREYPKIKYFENEKDVFGYTDVIQIEDITVFIMFMANKNGYPVEYIENSYFEQKDKPITKGPFWLLDYKRDLLKRIKQDLANKQEETKGR